MRTKEQKQEEVASLQKKLKAANSVLVIDYRGLTVSDANDLRGRLRKIGERSRSPLRREHCGRLVGHERSPERSRN